MADLLFDPLFFGPLPPDIHCHGMSDRHRLILSSMDEQKWALAVDCHDQRV